MLLPRLFVTGDSQLTHILPMKTGHPDDHNALNPILSQYFKSSTPSMFLIPPFIMASQRRGFNSCALISVTGCWC